MAGIRERLPSFLPSLPSLLGVIDALFRKLAALAFSFSFSFCFFLLPASPLILFPTNCQSGHPPARLSAAEGGPEYFLLDRLLRLLAAS